MKWQALPHLQRYTQVKDGVLRIKPELLSYLAEAAFSDIRRYFREAHLRHWREIFEDPKSSVEEKSFMYQNLLAATLAAEEGVPYCQDTGTDVAYLYRGSNVVFDASPESAIAEGARQARKKNPYRNSVFVPEKTGERLTPENNPPEIQWFSFSNPTTLFGIFAAKGGGSGSKSWSFSCPPALYQDEKALLRYLAEKIAEIGHAACPPYHLVIVLGGLSQLHNASILARALAEDPYLETSEPYLQPYKTLEKALASALARSCLGAQGKGAYFLMPQGLKVLRAPRHAAHFFVGLGVACSAHRLQAFKVTEEGVFLESLCKNPEKFLPPSPPEHQKLIKAHIKWEKTSPSVIKALRSLKAGDHFLVSGYILGARDKAHARWLAQYEQDGQLPSYLKEYPAVIYVGPADTPEGEVIGSFGPTTAGRMDSFAEFLLSKGLLPLSIGKGSRSSTFAKVCQRYGGMFAALQGGPASYLRTFVKSVEVLDFEDLGMEAVRLYYVENLPLQMIVDASGKDYFLPLAESFLQQIP